MPSSSPWTFFNSKVCSILLFWVVILILSSLSRSWTSKPVSVFNALYQVTSLWKNSTCFVCTYQEKENDFQWFQWIQPWRCFKQTIELSRATLFTSNWIETILIFYINLIGIVIGGPRYENDFQKSKRFFPEQHSHLRFW